MNFFQTVTVPQWIAVVLIPALISAVKLLMPAGPVQDALVLLIGSLGSTFLVSARKPSTQGGTTTPAVAMTVEGTVTTPKAAAESAKNA